MLFRLNLIDVAVIDVPMDPIYGDEISNLNVFTSIPIFFIKHLKNFGKRIIYSYYLRDMSIASIELPLGLLLLLFGAIYGATEWGSNIATSSIAPPGVVMLSGISVLTGLQLLLAFVSYDISQYKKSKL